MLEDPKYSDLKITNSGQSREWQVHRAIVCVRCPFFEACLKHSTKESQANVIDLPEDQPEHIDYLLRYLYTYDLNVAGKDLALIKINNNQARGFAELHSTADAFALFALADRLGLSDMKSHWQAAIMQIARYLDPDVTPRMPQYGGVKFDSSTPNDKLLALKSFFTHAYECENPGIEEIRALAIDTATQNTRPRNNTPQLVEILEDLIKEKPGFGMDLIRVTAERKKNQPVLDLLKYEAMTDMLISSSEIIYQLARSLAMS